MTVHSTEATNPDTLRYVELTRQRKARYVATNRRGGSIEVGEGDDAAFTPVELLLTALAACTAMDVDYIVGKRAEAESGWLRSSARKVRDGAGNHLADLCGLAQALRRVRKCDDLDGHLTAKGWLE